MPNPIQDPAPYVPSRAIAFAANDGTATVVGANAPLPVNTLPPAPSVIAGTTAVSALVGPFDPVYGRAVVLALSGTWTGTVKLQRSTDGGTTRLPVTMMGAAWGQFTANCCEPVWEEADESAVPTSTLRCPQAR